MQIKMIKVSELKPYNRNTKKHPKEQVEKLAKMITEYGFTVPILLAANNEIIAGHCRFESAKLLKMELVPCIKRADLSAAQVKALRIADNKITESEWDMEFLKEELDWLKDLDFDLSLTGWDALPVFEFTPPNESEPSDAPQALTLKVTFQNEDEQQLLFDELNERGFKVKI